MAVNEDILVFLNTQMHVYLRRPVSVKDVARAYLCTAREASLCTAL